MDESKLKFNVERYIWDIKHHTKLFKIAIFNLTRD